MTRLTFQPGAALFQGALSLRLSAVTAAAQSIFSGCALEKLNGMLLRKGGMFQDELKVKTVTLPTVGLVRA